MIKRIFSSSVDFPRLNVLKKCTQTWVIWVISNLMKIEIALREVSIYWIYNSLCDLDINAQDYQGCRVIDHLLLFSAAWLKESILTIRPWRHTTNWKNWKYIDRQSNFATTIQKIINEMKKNSIVNCICTAQVQCKTKKIIKRKNWYLYQDLS